MNNGLIGWIPESFSLQLIISVIIFIIPAFCFLMMGTFMPLMVWGDFSKEVMKASDGGKKWSKWEKVFVFFNTCIAMTMYVVWVRWLWTLKFVWVLDFLYGKGNSF